jgi:signal transduction histidine kinase
MAEAEWLDEPKSCGQGIEQMGRALHDLCQPLTTLQCGLELGALSNTPDSYREAVRVGLVESERLAKMVDSMREIMRAATCQSSRSER